MGGTCGWPALPLPVLTRLTMLSDAQRRAHQQRADAPKVLCQPIEAVGVPRQLARDGGAACHALRARRLQDLGARVARQCGPAAALPPQRDLCRKQACSVFGQLAPRWLLPASDHTPGCPRLRPASANQPLGRCWPATQASFSTSRLTLSISTSGVASSLSLSPPPPPPSSPSSSRLLTRLNGSLPCRCAQSSTVFSPTWVSVGGW